MTTAATLKTSRLFAGSIAAMLAVHSAHAANGTWTQLTSGGNWSTTGNWSGGTIADGSGFTADFSTINITADNTVHLDSARTLTSLTFGDTDPGTAGSWILDNNGNSGNILTLAGTPTITVKPLGPGKTATISAVITGTDGLTKLGTGTLTLNGANTYTGTTIIKNGALQIGDGTIGSLVGTNPLTFSGTGTFNVQEAASSNQGMGTLSFNAGQGTVKNTFNTTSSTLTFSGMNARSAGATANFTTSGGTNGTTNKIVLSSTTNAPMSNSGSNNQGIFFGLDSLSTAVSYARYDATGSGFFRATNYSGDTNATTTAGPYGSAVDLSLGNVTTSPGASVSLNTLRAVPTSNGQRFDVGTNTLSINGVLAVVPSQGVQFRVGSTTVGNGFLQPTSDGGEVVFAVARGNNAPLTTSSLAISNVIRDFSGGTQRTKVTTESNATMVFQASNTYTGVTTINSGLLRILRWADAGSASGLGMGSTGTTPNAADIVINGGILNFGNAGTGVNASTNRLFTIGPAGATLDVSGNSGTTGTLLIGSAGGNIAFSDSNAPASLTLAHNAPAANSLGTGTLGAVLGDPGTGTNVTSLTKTNAGTWILTAANTHHGVTRITGGTLQLGNNLALQNSIFDPSGGGTLAFSSGINTPTLGGLTSATNLTMASNVTALTLNPDTGVTATYSGALGSATAGMTLTKTGAGTQVLSGISTYSGATTISNGTLAINGSGSINNSAVTINGGTLRYNSSVDYSGTATFTSGTLGGTNLNGGLGNQTIGTSRILSPGNSPGLVTTTGQTWASGGTYLWEINNATGSPGSDPGWDLENGTGILDITATMGSPFNINVTSLTLGNIGGDATNFNSATNYNWLIADFASVTGFDALKFNFIDNFTNDTMDGTFGVALGSTGAVPGDISQIYLTYTAIPEPHAALLGAFGLLALLRRRR